MDYVRRVPPILVNLQGMIRDQGPELIEPTGFVVAGCLVEVAIRRPKQSKQKKFGAMASHPLPDPLPSMQTFALLWCELGHDG